MAFLMRNELLYFALLDRPSSLVLDTIEVGQTFAIPYRLDNPRAVPHVKGCPDGHGAIETLDWDFLSDPTCLVIESDTTSRQVGYNLLRSGKLHYVGDLYGAIAYLCGGELSVQEWVEAHHPVWAVHFARYYGHSDWAEESASRSPLWSLEYARQIKPTDKLRDGACQHPETGYDYAYLVDHEARDDTRNIACLDAGFAFMYARDVDRKYHPETYKACQGSHFEALYKQVISGCP